MNFLELAIVNCHSEISNNKKLIKRAEKAIEAANKDLNRYIKEWIVSDFFLDCEFEKAQESLATSAICIKCNLGTIYSYFNVTSIFKGFGINLYGDVHLLSDCKGVNITKLYGLDDDINRIYLFLIEKQNAKRNNSRISVRY